jgi:hypothetical protein
MASRKPTEFVQFKLRVREGLRKRIEREAKRRDESANNEAVRRLEESFEFEEDIAELARLKAADASEQDLRTQLARILSGYALRLMPETTWIGVTTARRANDGPWSIAHTPVSITEQLAAIATKPQGEKQ